MASAWVEWVGAMAAMCTTVSFVPQAWLTWRTRDVSGISVGMYSVFTTGVALWLFYGILIASWPIIIANVITLALAASILVMRLCYSGRQLSPGQKHPHDHSE